MSETIRKIIITIIILGLLGGTVWVGFYLYHQINQPSRKLSPDVPISHKTSISVEYYKTPQQNVFIIRWEYLPDGTTQLNVYRAKVGTKDYSLWKSVLVPQGEEDSGIAEIILSLKEEPGGYTYYVEAVRGGGGGSTTNEVVWTSDQNLNATSTDVLPPLPPAPTPGGTPTPSPAPNPSPAPTPTPTPASTTPTPTPAPNPTPAPTPTPTYPPGTIIYYKPDSNISGTSQPEGNHFWVNVVNGSIQIGWQNLPAGSAKLTVFRSANVNGPWSGILTQKNPVYDGPYSINVSDDTTNQSNYYKMEVYASSGALLTTYGPILLNP